MTVSDFGIVVVFLLVFNCVRAAIISPQQAAALQAVVTALSQNFGIGPFALPGGLPIV